jgi:hypothetical protein
MMILSFGQGALPMATAAAFLASRSFLQRITLIEPSDSESALVRTLLGRYSRKAGASASASAAHGTRKDVIRMTVLALTSVS